MVIQGDNDDNVRIIEIDTEPTDTKTNISVREEFDLLIILIAPNPIDSNSLLKVGKKSNRNKYVFTTEFGQICPYFDFRCTYWCDTMSAFLTEIKKT